MQNSLILRTFLGVGAGDGNRTHVASLEGWSSTIELHPRPAVRVLRPRQRSDPGPAAKSWWRGYAQNIVFRARSSTAILCLRACGQTLPSLVSASIAGRQRWSRHDDRSGVGTSVGIAPPGGWELEFGIGFGGPPSNRTKTHIPQQPIGEISLRGPNRVEN